MKTWNIGWGHWAKSHTVKSDPMCLNPDQRHFTASPPPPTSQRGTRGLYRLHRMDFRDPRVPVEMGLHWARSWLLNIRRCSLSSFPISKYTAGKTNQDNCRTLLTWEDLGLFPPKSPSPWVSAEASETLDPTSVAAPGLQSTGSDNVVWTLGGRTVYPQSRQDQSRDCGD